MLKHVNKAIRTGTKGSKEFSAQLTKVVQVDTIDDIQTLLDKVRQGDFHGVDKKLLVAAINCGLDLKHRAAVKPKQIDDTELALMAIKHFADTEPTKVGEMVQKGTKWLAEYATNAKLVPQGEDTTTDGNIADSWEKQPATEL